MRHINKFDSQFDKHTKDLGIVVSLANVLHVEIYAKEIIVQK